MTAKWYKPRTGPSEQHHCEVGRQRRDRRHLRFERLETRHLLASEFDNTPDPHPATPDDDGAAEVSGIDPAFYAAVLDAALITDNSGNQLDGDGNGTVGDDFQHVLLVAKKGDSDVDGDVDLSDYNTLTVNFDPGGQNAPHTWCTANFDRDGDIDLTDYNVMAGSFAPGGYAGTTPPGYGSPCFAAVPLAEAPDVFSDQNVIGTTAEGATGVFATGVPGDGDADVPGATFHDGETARYENMNSEPMSAPQVISVLRNGGDDTFDTLETLAITFSEAVNVNADALALSNYTAGGTLLDLTGVAFGYNPVTLTATWDFSADWLDVTISPVGVVDVGRYEVFELSLAHDDTPYASPFWDVLTEATFVSPGGVTFDVEGFYYDEDTWMVRFAPTIEGTWTYEVTMRATGGSYRAAGSFNCVESSLHGQLRDHPTNPKRLIFDDGTPFGGLGTNIWTYDNPFLNGSTISGATAVDRWNTYFSEYATHGADVYRRLLGTEKHPDGSPGAPWYQGHVAIWHGEEGPERYSLERARDMDDEFAALRENNIALQLCLYDKPRSWSGNPLNVANGGPLASSAQLYDITDATVTDLHKKYIRYIVNRYGAYVSIWELFNEFNSGNGLSLSWKEEMADHIRSLDPYGSAVTTSTTGGAPGDSWQDFQSPHLYLSMSGDHLDSGSDGTAIARNIDNWIRSRAGGLDRPNLFGEFGTGNCMPNDDPDAWRVSIWAAYFEESGLAFWDDRESLQFGVNSCERTWNGNAYISDETRDLFLIRKQFTDRLSPTMTQVDLSTSDPGNLRSFGLEDPPLGLFAAWVHNFTDHAAVNAGKTVSITLPSGAFLAAWVDPKDGSTLSTAAISGGTVMLSAPAFEQDVALIVRPDAPVEVRTASLPDGVHGDEYYELLEATGGGRPYAWSITAGALPTGVVLDPQSGLLSGAPAYGGAATFTIQVVATDSSSASAEFTLTSTGP